MSPIRSVWRRPHEITHEVTPVFANEEHPWLERTQQFAFTDRLDKRTPPSTRSPPTTFRTPRLSAVTGQSDDEGLRHEKHSKAPEARRPGVAGGTIAGRWACWRVSARCHSGPWGHLSTAVHYGAAAGAVWRRGRRLVGRFEAWHSGIRSQAYEGARQKTSASCCPCIATRPTDHPREGWLKRTGRGHCRVWGGRCRP